MENTFSTVRVTDSEKIYRELTAGKIITKHIYHGLKAEEVDNSLFTALFNAQEHYRQFYQHMGLNLILDESGLFYYLTDGVEDTSDEADENAFKIQVALLLLGRFYSRTGRDVEHLARIDMGIDEKDLNTLSEEEEYNDILRTARLPSQWDKVMDYLCDRGFAHRTSERRYILNSAGLVFINELIESYQEVP